jgi:nitrous oxidase accessory protein NosD
MPDLIVSASGEAQYRTVREAVAAAPPDAHIRVRPGRYAGGLILDKPLEIAGDGPAGEIVIEAGDESCLRMEARSARVRGLSLHCKVDPDAKEERPCVDVLSGELLLEDCDIASSSGPCVLIHGAQSRSVLRRCTIHDGEDVGVAVSEGARATLEDCHVYGHVLAGVETFDEGEAVLRECRISEGRQVGVSVDEGGRATLEDCEVCDNRSAGVAVEIEAHAILRRCEVQGNDRGIQVSKNGSAVVEDCDLTGNTHGSWQIRPGGSVQQSGNREDRGQGLLLNLRDGLKRLLEGL